MHAERRDIEHWLLYGTTETSLDQHDRLREHIICRSCGYDLVSMHKGQQCPECGAPVAFSMRGDVLSHSHPGWSAQVGQHVRFSGLLLIALPIMLVVATILSRPVSGIGPGIVLLAWCYMVLQATRREPVQTPLTRVYWTTRGSAGVLALIVGISLLATGLGWPTDGQMIFALAAPAFIVSLTFYIRWLSNLVLRVPCEDLCEALRRRMIIVLALSAAVVVMILAQAGLGIYFLGLILLAPAWLLYVVILGYACVQAGDMILFESRLARQNWLEREALLDKEQRFPDPTCRPSTGDAEGIPA